MANKSAKPSIIMDINRGVMFCLLSVRRSDFTYVIVPTFLKNKDTIVLGDTFIEKRGQDMMIEFCI